ncbi:galactose-1-phosphate uridylyltransferase [Desulfurococcaceae archaeon MEX13E-LK6-19]|nr:galactose-1-phosphate uridylyltransferase [Desulfurococcaceae archaeon MEX13E-LK6-19]
MVSSIREKRPWRPHGFCPFCPGAPEMGYGWKVKIVENKYPMLIENPPPVKKHWFYTKKESRGKCLVVVETPVHDLDDLSDLSIDDIGHVIREIKNALNHYRDKHWAKYFFWFRNKGEEIGVSLKHPHSQIYILPFIPSKIERELINSKRFFEKENECLFCKIISVEKKDKERIVFETKEWISFIPFYAHWPFEVHIYPKRHIQLLTELNDKEINELAITLKTVLQGIKNIFERPMPYMMVLHQAPLDNHYPYYHLHIEIYGIYRPSGKMKYAAGMETGGGNFTYDSMPEENAAKLRHVINSLYKNNYENTSCRQDMVK